MAAPAEADAIDPAWAALALVLSLPAGSRARVTTGFPGGDLVRERLAFWGVEVEQESARVAEGARGSLAAISVSTPAARQPATVDPAAGPTQSRHYCLDLRRASLARWGWIGRPFRSRQGWALVPGAERPNYLVPLANPRVPAAIERDVLGQQFLPLNRSGWRQRLRGLAARAMLWPGLRRWAPAVLVEAEPSSAGDGPEKGTIQPAAPATSFTEEVVSHALGETAVPILWMVRLSHSVVVPCWVPGRQTVVFAKLALSPLAAAAQGRQAAFVRWLSESGQAVVPVPPVLATGNHRGQDYLVEEGLPGTGGGRIRLPLDRLLPPATAALVELARASADSADVDRARSLWRSRLAALGEHPWLAGQADWRSVAERAGQALSRLSRSVVSHNDFHLGNVIYDRAGQLTGVLDWDLADAEGLPATDLIHLLVSVALRRRRTTKTAVLAGLAAGRFPAEAAAWSRYAQAIEIDAELARWLPLYVATQVWRLIEQARFAPSASRGAGEMANQARLLLAWQAGRRDA